jgi:uncharacterized protein
MISKDLLKTIIITNQAQSIPQTWERTMKVPTNSGKIITLVGVRRSGKTYHLFHIMNELKQAGVTPEQILYINFEDERLDLTSSELDVILQAYRELYPNLDLATCYFFFDEIQEVEGWEKFIDRLYSSISRNVFVTGSNAKLLSQEIASALRGRPITFEVYPLSFHEFITVVSPNLNQYDSADRATLVNLFERFLVQGGFPEIITQEEGLKDKILQEYFNVMLFKDLVDRYKITQIAVLKYFCKRIIGTSASEFSVNKIYNELKSQGYGISKDTLYDFQNYVETIYLNRFVAKYAYSVVKSEGSQKKTYVIDQGLGAALDFKLSQDKGRLLENTVALELLKQGKRITYQQDGGECDFVLSEKDTPNEAIQVTFDFVDEQTRKREIKGLVQCCKVLSLEKGIILTFDLEEQFENDGIQVTVLPVWKYFL